MDTDNRPVCMYADYHMKPEYTCFYKAVVDFSALPDPTLTGVTDYESLVENEFQSEYV